MASESLTPPALPPLGPVHSADAALEGNLTKLALLQKAGMILQVDGGGPDKESSDDDGLDTTYIRRVRSASNLYPPSAMRGGRPALPQNQERVRSSSGRKVSWAPDVPPKAPSASYLNDTDSGKPFDFLAFVDRARQQNEKRSSSSYRGQKPKSRRPSAAANLRWHSYYSDDNEGDTVSMSSLGNPRDDILEDNQLAPPLAALMIHSAPTSPVLALPDVINGAATGAGTVDTDADGCEDEADDERESTDRRRGALSRPLAAADGKRGAGLGAGARVSSASPHPPRSPRFRVVSPGRASLSTTLRVGPGPDASEDADGESERIRPVSLDCLPTIASASADDSFPSPPEIDRDHDHDSSGTVKRPLPALRFTSSSGTFGSAEAYFATVEPVPAPMPLTPPTVTRPAPAAATTPTMASPASSDSVQQRPSSITRTPTRSRFQVRSVQPAIQENAKLT